MVDAPPLLQTPPQLLETSISHLKPSFGTGSICSFDEPLKQTSTFLHAGTEFLRTKKGVENSFESPDSINAIDWSLKTTNKTTFEYIKHLIQLRKNHPAFRMQTVSQIQKNTRFLENLPEGVVAFEIDGRAVNDSWKKILVCFNGSDKTQPVSVGSTWQSYILNNLIVQSEKVVSNILLAPHSCTILFQ